MQSAIVLRLRPIMAKYRQGKDFVVEYPKKNGKVGKVLFYNNGFCRNPSEPDLHLSMYPALQMSV